MADNNQQQKEQLAEKLQQQQIKGNQNQPQSPLDQLNDQINTIKQQASAQQQQTEANVQETLAQVSTGIEDSQALGKLLAGISQLNQLLQSQGLQGDITAHDQVLAGLEAGLQQQIQSTNQRLIQSLQQAVSTLAQSNAALLDGNSCHQMLNQIQKARLLLSNWQAGSYQVH